MTPDSIDEQIVDSSTTVAAADLAPGTILDGRYEIIGLVAEGAMGRVYRAKHLAMERDVAIKTMHLHLLRSSEALERFKREVVVSGGLNHPGIVRVYASGIASGGEPFLVMDFLTGSSLATILRQGSLTLSRFFDLFGQVIEALQHAHAQGIVHRDLKPSNIFVTADGGVEKAVLIDFGIAKAIAESADQKVTQTGALVGTSSYMSPEQCTTGVTDTRSDIYSLGCVMYEALVGKPPFEGESAFDVMYKHLHQSLSDLGALNKLPRELSEMILKCMQKSPERRYGGAAELQKDFQQCAKQSKSLRYRLFVRPKLQVQIAAAVLTLVIGGGVAFNLLNSEKKHNEPEQTATRVLKAGDVERPPRDVEQLTVLAHTYRNDLKSEVDVNKILRSWLSTFKNDPNVAPWERAEVVAFLAQSYEALGEYKISEQLINQSLKDLTGRKRLSVEIQLAKLHTQLQRFDLAEKELKKILEQIGPTDRMRINVLSELGNIRFQSGDLKGAEQYQEELMAALRTQNLWNDPYGNSLKRRGAEILFLTGKHDQARKFADEHVKIMRAGAKSDGLLAYELSAAAGLYKKMGDHARFELLALEAAKMQRQLHKDSVADDLMGTVALSLDARGQYSQAVKSLEQTIQDAVHAGRVKDAARSRVLRARIHHRNFAPKEALEDANLAVRAYPDVDQVVFEEALSLCLTSLTALHKNDEAERMLEQYKDLSNTDSYKAFWYGCLATQRRVVGDSEGDMEAYKSALKYRQQDHTQFSNLKQAELWSQLAICHMDRSESAAAMECYGRACSLLRGSPSGRSLLLGCLARQSHLLAAQRKADEAQLAADEMMKLSRVTEPTEHATSLIELGRMNNLLHRFAKARDCFEKAAEVSKAIYRPAHNDLELVARTGYAESIYRLGKKDEAKKLLRQIDEQWQKPEFFQSLGNFAALALLSRFDAEEKNYKAAIADMETIANRYEKSPMFRYESLFSRICAGTLYGEKGDHKTAYEMWQKSIDMADSTRHGRRLKALALRNCADLLKQDGHLHESRTYYEQAIREYDESYTFAEESVALSELAMLLEQMKLLHEASETWLRAVTIARKAPGIPLSTINHYIERAQKANPQKTAIQPVSTPSKAN